MALQCVLVPLRFEPPGYFCAGMVAESFSAAFVPPSKVEGKPLGCCLA